MIDKTLASLEEQNLLRLLTPTVPGPGSTVRIGNRLCISFASNDYLGLSRHPELIATGQRSLQEFGCGSGASRLMAGSLLPHHEFERDIASFLGSESARLFGSGYLANLAWLSILPQRNDLILADRLIHASLVEGCKISGAQFRLFRHNDMNHLESLLAANRNAKRVFVVTEGVFSMEGDLAPLPEVLDLTDRFDARLLLDDAHGFGILGRNGRGTASHFDVDRRIEYKMGTLGKAAGLSGAFIAGPDNFIQFLSNRAKTFIYTTAPPPFLSVMAQRSVALIEAGDSLRARLRENRTRLSSGFQRIGIPVPESPSPIIPVFIGDNRIAAELSRSLLESGLYIPAIRPPTVPSGRARLRISVSALHTAEEIDTCVERIEQLGKDHGIFAS